MATIMKQKPRPVRPLDLADRQIRFLKTKLLPYDPHLLQVDIKVPYNGGFAYEFEGTPFENYEVKDLQYMTMISDGSRGIADARGDWQNEINSRSPSVQAARSNTATPNPGREAKGPLKKISFGAYKNKKAGITTTLQSGATYDGRPAHSRNTSDVSISTPMNRVPSFEGGADAKQNGASLVVIATERAASKSVAQNPNTSESKPKVNSSVNGHNAQPSKGSLQPKDTNKSVQPTKTSAAQSRNQLKNGLPPRPQSPVKSVERKPPTSEPKQLKRPLESADSPHEKRTKMEHIRIPSGTFTHSSRRPEPLSDKKHQDSLKASSQPSKTSPSKQSEGKDTAKSEKPLRMPPLLSPLPADIENSSAPIPKVRISEPAKSSTSSPKPKLATDTIAVKSKLSTSSPFSTPPKSNSSPYVLPRLLSPTLPDVVEEELLRIHKKSTTAAQNGVEARHENARRPDAPGVARKMPKTAKKTVAEAPKSSPVPEKESLIVKLKYKKRKATNIARILKLQSKPSKQFLTLEKENTARPKPKDESEDDTPVPPIPKSNQAATAAKKRPSDSYDSRKLESAAKRTKVADTIDVPKPRPASTALTQAKSPLPSAPSQKNQLITPKKGDAIKSIAMRKIDSNDGNVRTPQTANTNTPASAEKPRTNGDIRSFAEHDSLSAKSSNLDAQALKLKRKMDEILQTKARPQVAVGDSQRIYGLCVGMECVVMYLQSFDAKEKLLRARNHTAWEGGIGLWAFIDAQTRRYPILSALSCQLGAVFKEELGRVYNEMLGNNHSSPRFLGDLKSNQSARDSLWKAVHRSRSDLDALGIKEVTGPWTSIEEITTYTLKVLERYAQKEKTGWRLSN